VARIRTYKPSFFRSEDVSVLPLRARLTWLGIWTQCDDQGRTKDNVKLIKADVWPLDPVSLADIEEDLITLAGHGRIVRYEVDGQRYLEVVNWDDHQKISHPSKSKIPAPSYPQAIPPEGSGSALEGSSGEGKGREGKGGDARASPEPPRQCPPHTNNPNPGPCGPCADARRAHAQWETDRNRRNDNAPKCALHRGQPAHNCGPCRAERLAADTLSSSGALTPCARPSGRADHG
jgi:hypothetical protein